MLRGVPDQESTRLAPDRELAPLLEPKPLESSGFAAARDVTRRHGSGDAEVDALRCAAVRLAAGR